MKYLLGIDFGGGASKAVILNEFGDIVAVNSVEYPTYYTAEGACEQSPDDWIRALCDNISALLEISRIKPSDISAVAVDSATHTSVVCDRDFKPLRNAVHWTDTRSRLYSDKLRNEYGSQIFSKTFHIPDTIWTLPQILWLKESEPELFGKTRHIFFEKDYIRYFLTGVFCTDYIEAEGSMLFNCNTMAYDSELCTLAGIDISFLPEIKNPTDIIGVVTEKAAGLTGLCPGTPVICGTTDTAAEVFASGAAKTGDITVKLATAGRICVVTDKPYPDKNLVNYSHVLSGLWYPGTATKAAASSYRWYRDTFGGIYSELDAAASQVNIGCDGLIFHPYINGELTPYSDPQLCGSFTGVRSTHTRAHFTRAVLEGVAYSLLECKLYLDSLDIPYNKTATLIGGGAKGKLWQQITADTLGIPLKTTQCSDSSLGSAMLAGIAAGVFGSADEAIKLCVRPGDVIIPNPANTAEYRRVFGYYRMIHDALEPIYRGR